MKAFKIFVSLLLICLMFTGCMSHQSLHDLTIVEGMGIDKKDDNFSVTVQTLNLAKEGNGSEALAGNITVNTSEEGSTISQAVSKLSKDLSKKLFMGQNKLIIIGKETAQKGIEDNLDYFVRSSDSRADINIAVSDKKAEDILKSKENDALVPCENMVNLLKNGERSGMGADVNVNEMLKKYFSKTSDIYLPVIENNKDHVSFGGLALFQKNKLKTITDSEETFGILLMNDKIKDGLVSLKDEKLGNIGVEIITVKTNPYTEYKDGKVIFNENLSVQIMLDEVEKGYVSVMNSNKISEVENLAEKRLSELCRKAYTKITYCGCDCINVGEYLCKNDKKSYEIVCKKWDDYFTTSSINVNVKCKITKVNDNSIRE